MFGKFFGKKDTQPSPPTQSQSMSGVTVNGGQVQQAQAGRDGTAAQQGQMQTQQQGLSGAEVVALLGTLKGAIGSSGISEEQKEDLLDFLKGAMKEADRLLFREFAFDFDFKRLTSSHFTRQRHNYQRSLQPRL